MSQPFVDGLLVSLFTAGVWGVAKLVFGRKTVATWKWERRGFYRAYWYLLYYFSLVACGASIAYREWFAAAVFGVFYWLMGKQEPEVRSGALFRRAYVEEAKK